MKDMVFDVNSKQMIEVEISADEQAKREADAAKAREEASKPQPPSVEDQIAFLKERDARMQDDLSSIIEGLTGGV